MDEIKWLMKHYSNDIAVNNKGGIKLENIDIWPSYNHNGKNIPIEELYKYTPLTIQSFMYYKGKIKCVDGAEEDLKNKVMKINNPDCIDKSLLIYVIENMKKYSIDEELKKVLSKLPFKNLKTKYKKHYGKELSLEKMRMFMDEIKS